MGSNSLHSLEFFAKYESADREAAEPIKSEALGSSGIVAKRIGRLACRGHPRG